MIRADVRVKPINHVGMQPRDAISVRGERRLFMGHGLQLGIIRAAGQAVRLSGLLVIDPNPDGEVFAGTDTARRT